MGSRPRLALALALVALLSGCSGDDESARREASALTLRVMTFNVFYGGDELDLAKDDWCTKPEGCQDTFALVLDAIRRSEADVVGLQEATGNTRPIAEELDWHFDERTQVISRFPIVDPGGADGLYVFVEPRPGEVVAISNVHLPATPYGPYQLEKGASPEKVVRLEDGRLRAIEPQVESLPPLAEEGIPVFLTGDFNSPSHLDEAHGIEWPVSKALADAGFRDSFRVVHPDTTRPGFTWTPGGPESVRNEVHDRIDWVLSAGPARAVASSVVGEAEYEGTDIGLDQWPSDHRGVVSTFRVTPAAMPELVAVESRALERGETLDVRFQTQKDGARLLLRPSGEVLEPPAATDDLEPGRYDVVLADAQGNEIAATEVWLYAPGSEATISTSKRTYEAGERIRVSWTNAPGMKWDWIAPFRAGQGADHPRAETCLTGVCGNGGYLGFKYTRAKIEGSTTLPGLEPGRYDVRLLVDDGYRRAAISEPFRVIPR